MIYECIPELVLTVAAACHTIVIVKKTKTTGVVTHIHKYLTTVCPTRLHSVKPVKTANRMTLQEQNFSVQLYKFHDIDHHFSGLSMTFAVFHDFPGLENGPPKFRDFPEPVGTL